MPSTARSLRKMATVITNDGLHTGDQFGTRGVIDRLDLCAIAYIVAEDCPAPAEFFTDEGASIALIEASQPAMELIRAISAHLDFSPPHINGTPQYIDHVSNWARTTGIGETEPPTTTDVIGRLLRTADALTDTLARFPHQRAA